MPEIAPVEADPVCRADARITSASIRSSATSPFLMVRPLLCPFLRTTLESFRDRSDRQDADGRRADDSTESVNSLRSKIPDRVSNSRMTAVARQLIGVAVEAALARTPGGTVRASRK